MKLYQIKEKVNNEVHQFVIDGSDFPKEHLQENVTWGDFDFRTLKELPMPKGRLEVSDLDDMYYILFDGEVIVSWADNAHYDYPEDLTWSRTISGLIRDVERLKDLEFKRKNEDV